jgi:outer membrane lipoprotein SlyB
MTLTPKKIRTVVLIWMLIAFILTIASLGGCATTPLTGRAYQPNDARRVEQVEYGKVVGLRAVTIEPGQGSFYRPTTTNVATGIGALAGGVLGSMLGTGRWAIIGTTVGAVGGGLAGHVAGDAIATRSGVELTIQLDSGQTMAVVQQQDPSVAFRMGDRVEVVTNGSTTRVALAAGA